MALTGLQATCGFAGDKTSPWNAKQPVFADPQWSETLAIPGTSGQAVPADGMIMHYTAGAECYVTQATTPNASLAISTSPNSARLHLSLGETLDVYARFNDKINVVSATLSGLHVTCGFAGYDASNDGAKSPVFAFPVWSETLSGTAVTGQSAPSSGCVFHIKASVPYYFAVGLAPDATLAASTSFATTTYPASNAARTYVAAGVPFDVYVRAGYKLACAAA